MAAIVINPQAANRIQSLIEDPSYKEALEQSSTYNSRLCNERKLRLPFLDSQTGVAQSHCNLWMSRRQRMPGQYPGQLYSYPAKRWRKKRRQYLLNDRIYPKEHHDEEATGDSDMHQISMIENSASKDSLGNDDIGSERLAALLSGGTVDETSKDSWYKDFEDINEPPDAGEIEDLDSDNDDFEETYIKKKKRRPGSRGGSRGRGRKIEKNSEDPEKPYGCEVCGTRYKTRPGLAYHYSHSHCGTGGPPPPPPNQAPNVPPHPAMANHPPGMGDSQPPDAMSRYPHHLMPPTGNRMGGEPPADMYHHHQQQQAAHLLHPHQPPPHQMPPQQPPPPPPQHMGVPANQHQAPPSIPIPVPVPVPVPTAAAPPPPPPPQQQQQPAPPSSTPSSSGQVAQQNPATSADDPLAGLRKFQDSFLTFLKSPGSGQRSASGKPLANPSPYCDFCLGDHSENKKTGRSEELVSCADCGRSGHPSCLQFTDNMVQSVKKYRWQCIECKSCGLCGTSDNDEQLLFCDDCDRGYHMYCLNPPLSEPPEGSWSCHLCIEEFGKK